MADFLAKSILTAAALNARFNSLGYRGDFTTVSPKINGSATGIAGTFLGKYVQVLNAVCLLQVQLSFTSIGSSVGNLTLDIDGANLFNGGALTSQALEVVNVARLSGGTKTPINTTLFGLIQAKTITLISSQYNGNSTRVLTNTDLSNTSYFEISGAYITGN